MLVVECEEIPPVTWDLPVDETCEYSDIVGLASFADQFTTAGGVNLPKIITCKDVHSKTHKQVVKVCLMM